MNLFVKIIMLVAVVVALAATYNYVSAQDDEQTMSHATPPRVSGSSVVGINHVLKATYFNTCLPSCPSIALPAGSAVALDSPTTITCAAPIGKTCTITDTAWVETQDTSGLSNNPGSIGFILDSTQTDIFFSGSTGTPKGFFFDGLYVKIAAIGGVSPGTHTVQTTALSENGGNFAGQAEKYEVYTP